MRTLDPNFKAAIKNYFIAKYRDGTGNFIVPGEKTVVCDEVCRVGSELGMDITILPGLIMARQSNGDWIFFTKENKHIGYKVAANIDNPLGVFLKRKKTHA